MFWAKALNPQLRTQWKPAPIPNAPPMTAIVNQNCAVCPAGSHASGRTTSGICSLNRASS